MTRFGVQVSVGPATLLEQAFEHWRGGHQLNGTTTAHKIAATLDWETATMGDLLDLSAESGVQAGLIYRAIHHRARIDPERVSDP